MKKPQQARHDKADTTRPTLPLRNPDPASPAGNAIPFRVDSSGEGAASALDLLRKLEHKRRQSRPADDPREDDARKRGT